MENLPDLLLLAPGNASKTSANSYPGLLAGVITPDLCDHTWPNLAEITASQVDIPPFV
jgi:hypothetical protein